MYENRNKQHSSASYFCCCVVTISVLNPYSSKSVFCCQLRVFLVKIYRHPELSQKRTFSTCLGSNLVHYSVVRTEIYDGRYSLA